MGRARRHIVAGEVYELCFRAKSGLPFVIYKLINLIIQGVVARVQRDFKVILCHDIWNGSHAHIIVIAKDHAGVSAFAGQIEKRLTDCLKRLLGLSSLSLWDGRPRIIPILDAEKVTDRIAYLYANPGQDNIVDSIETFPGVSSWQDFSKASSDISFKAHKNFPHIRLRDLPLLRDRRLTHRQDEFYTSRIIEHAQEFHPLDRQPNAWMGRFGVTSGQQVAKLNETILRKTRALEEIAREKREIEGKQIFSRNKLLSQPILKDHTPPPKEGNILCMATDRKDRLFYRKKFKRYQSECTECYQRERVGEQGVLWPPGAFKPPSRLTFNMLPSRSSRTEYPLMTAEQVFSR